MPEPMIHTERPTVAPLPAGALPGGDVTFLFTDIEGSTELWERHPETMGEAVARHDEILRRAIEDHGGHVFKTVGDAFHAVFTEAPAALGAANWRGSPGSGCVSA